MSKFCYTVAGALSLYAVADYRVYNAKRNLELIWPAHDRSYYIQRQIDEFTEWRNMPILAKITNYPDLPQFL